jgi:nucleoside-diphosphate-sugar epimerase
MPIVLITGAAGHIGTMLRPRLARPGRALRLLDTAPITAGPGEEAVRASVTDPPRDDGGLPERDGGDSCGRHRQ